MVDGLECISNRFDSRASVARTDQFVLRDIDAEEVSWSLHGESLQHKLRVAGVALLHP